MSLKKINYDQLPCGEVHLSTAREKNVSGWKLASSNDRETATNASVLVTGGTGFLGRHLVARLREDGFKVIVGDVEGLGAIPLDVRDENNVDQVFKTVSPDVVVHLAAKVGGAPSVEDSYDFYRTNILGTLNICEAASHFGSSKIVYVSSLSVHGYVRNEDLPITEETPLSPGNPYGGSKACGELIVKEYSARNCMKAVTLRSTFIYGPTQIEMNPIQRFFDTALRQKIIELYGGGSHTREFLFVDDVVEAIIAAIKLDNASYETFLISSGEPIALRDLAGKISMMVGDVSIRRTKTTQAMFSHRCDISRARSYLEWKPRVSLEDGLWRTFQWRKNSTLPLARGLSNSADDYFRAARPADGAA